MRQYGWYRQSNRRIEVMKGQMKQSLNITGDTVFREIERHWTVLSRAVL